VSRLAAAIALACIALAGCEALLGVDDVVLDDGGGGNGGGGDAAATLGVGAGFAVSGPAASTGTDALASSGSGGVTCQPDLPACAGATPTAFEGPGALAGTWSVDRRKVEVKGNKLEVDPDDEAASMRSMATLDTSVACAVWITLEGPDDDEASAGIAVGDGGPGAEWMGVFRNTDTVVATSRGQAIGTTSVPAGPARNVLRIRADGAGSIAADLKREGGCFEQVAATPIPSGAPSVTVFQVGHNGKSHFDDYCL
jgi:hypothetical protein